MADGIIPGRKTFERIEKALPLVERFLPPRPEARRQTSDGEKRLWWKCIPDSASVPTAPAYGVIQLVNGELDSALNPVFRYKRPDAANLTNTAILWGQDISAGTVSDAEGLCTFEPSFALYNTAATPTFDQDWGTEANSFLLKSGNTGYKILGAAGSGRVLVRKPDSVVGKAKLIQFTLTQAIAVTDASATASVLRYMQGTNPDPSSAGILVYNSEASTNYIFAGVSGAKGWAAYDDLNDRYRIFQLQCG